MANKYKDIKDEDRDSKYSRKRKYLRGLSRREGRRVFGFEVPEPKPWKTKKD